MERLRSQGRRVALPLFDVRSRRSSPCSSSAPRPRGRRRACAWPSVGDYGSATGPPPTWPGWSSPGHPTSSSPPATITIPTGPPRPSTGTSASSISDFIFPYRGSVRPGCGDGTDSSRCSATTTGIPPGAAPYLEYFTLPGNERYYDVVLGPVHFFMLDSDPREPDGHKGDAQAAWLQAGLAASTARWKIVVMHHPPYSSGPHGSSSWMQWRFEAWGADAVLSGHDHLYERVTKRQFPYFVNGLGGQAAYAFQTPVDGSQARYNARTAPCWSRPTRPRCPFAS